MNILVILKQIPYEMEIYQDTDFLNDSDVNVITEALDLRDSCGGKVTVMVIGPFEGESILKEAYTYGVDSAILLMDDIWRDMDIRGAGRLAAAAAVYTGPYDLILFGRQALDGDSAHMAAMTAGYLQMPLIAYSDSITINEDRIAAYCMGDHMDQRIHSMLPAVVMSCSEKKRGRYPSVANIMKAYNGTYTVRIITSQALCISVSEKTVRLSRTCKPEISNHCGQIIFQGMDETGLAGKMDDILCHMGYLQKRSGE